LEEAVFYKGEETKYNFMLMENRSENAAQYEPDLRGIIDTKIHNHDAKQRDISGAPELSDLYQNKND